MSSPANAETNAPYIFAHSLGKQLDMNAQEFPRANADGLPVVNLTQEQKYLFDTRGWLLIPGLLTEEETEEMREFCLRLHHDPDSIPEHQRSPLGGPMQKLADHPVVVGFMNEFVAFPPLSRQNCYGFRMESCSLFYRQAGDGQFSPPQRQRPLSSSRRHPLLPLHPRQSARRPDPSRLGTESDLRGGRNARRQRQPQSSLRRARLDQ